MQASIQSCGVFQESFAHGRVHGIPEPEYTRRSQEEEQEQGGQEQDFTLWNAANPHSISAVKRY